MIQDISVQNLKQFFIKIDLSNVTLINNFTIKDSSNTLHISESIIHQVSDSHFYNNGGENKLKGGALTLLNSEVTIQDSTFQNNTAFRGGAISFE